jgi:hypothetical protein
MFSIFKKILFWNYKRTSWQYDVLCVLILAFIFLTPKHWFENTEYRWSQNRQVAFVQMDGKTRFLLPAAPAEKGAPPAKEEVEKRLRAATGRPDLRVKDIYPLRDERGEVTAFAIDTE